MLPGEAHEGQVPSRRVRVAIIGTRGYPSFYGGFETAVRRLAPYLADRGHTVRVYGRRGAVVEDFPYRDSRVESKLTAGIEKQSLSTLSYGFTAVVHAILRRPDVALVMNVANGFWLPLLKLARIPTVVNVDGIEWERDKWGRLARSMFRLGARFTALFADQLIADSIEIQRRWKDEFKRDSIYIPYGGEEDDDGDVREATPSGSSVLVVARLVPENSIELFLDAVPELAETCEVTVVGSSGYGGPLEVRLAELASRFENVRWLGHVRDDDLLFDLWRKTAVYFHGHSVGGTNPALVQAMHLGAATVARDTAYNREVLGEAGLFTAPDAASIARACRELLRDDALRAQLSKTARERARDYFGWEAVCERYTEALLDLVA